jgi:hypothetical protein
MAVGSVAEESIPASARAANSIHRWVDRPKKSVSRSVNLSGLGLDKSAQICYTV